MMARHSLLTSHYSPLTPPHSPLAPAPSQAYMTPEFILT